MTEILQYDRFIETPGLKTTVSEEGGRLKLEMCWQGGESNQTLLLPRFLSSLDGPRRPLEVVWGEGLKSQDIYLSLMEGLSTYIGLKYPGFWTVVPIISYEQVSHGEMASSFYRFVSIVGLIREISEDTRYHQRKRGGLWTGGYSDIILISPEPGYHFKGDVLPNFPFDIPRELFLPMVDLDVQVSNNGAAVDLREVSVMLAGSGVSGWLIRSGSLDRGSYHFLGDFVMPYEPCFWQVKGRLMNLLTPAGSEFDYLHAFADRIESASSLNAARVVAREILEKIPSNLETGSFADFRWFAHRIIAGMSILRSLPAKGYQECPSVVGEIK